MICVKYPFQNPDLDLETRVKDLVSRLTLDEKINMLSTWQKGVERLGINDWHIGAEVARGYVSRRPEITTTVFPQPIGMAGMFDPELMEKLGEIAGIEARILHSRNPRTNLMLWGPTVDACRDPRWGRNEESYGEDPYLTGQMSIGYTKGMAGSDPVYMRTIPTLKHFFANNNEERRGSCDANLEPRTKYEYYYEFFRPSIEEGGARSMMTSYNSVSGVPAIVNPELRSIVKDQWGLDFVVTDGGDFTQNVHAHHYSDTHAETIALALKAGNDIMTDGGDVVAIAARDALAKGMMTEEDIDRSLCDSLRARFKLGEFDPKERNPYSDPDPALMDCAEHRATNHRAALEQMVLLKNDGALPLKKGVKIALIGDIGDKNYMDWYTGYSSYNISILDGLKAEFGEENVVFDDCHDHVAIRSKLNGKFLCAGGEGIIRACAETPDADSTFAKADWGGEVTYKVISSGKFFTAETMKADSDTTFRWYTQEILRPSESKDGITYTTYFKRQVLGVAADGTLEQVDPREKSADRLFEEVLISSGAERAAKLAKEADVVIVCCGNDPMIVARECYDRTTLALPPHQTEIVMAAEKENKRTVMAVVSSYPYSIVSESEAVPAVIYSSHAGPELGSAFAEVICGKYNPAGRLAQTWYRSEHELPSIFDYDIIKNDMTYLYYKGDPLYPFGYGLSYSSFKYSNFGLERRDGKTVVSFDLKNISEVDGEEIAQVYFRAVNPRVKRPLKQLCAFRRLRLAAGESKRLSFDIKDRELRFYDVTRDRFCVESGRYEFMAGASCEDIRLRGFMDIRGERIPSRDLGVTTKAINYDDKVRTKMMFAKYLCRNYMSGGELIFRNVKFRAEKSIELRYSTGGRGGRIRVYCGDELICEEMIPGTASANDFVYATVKLKSRRGVHDLRLALDGVNLLEFKMA